MSSYDELYKGYAPYFKEEKKIDEYTKEISLMPSEKLTGFPEVA